MRVVVIEPPLPILTWQEARDHLRLDEESEQADVMAMVAAVSAHIDGPDGWLCRSIGAQLLEARFAAPYCRRVRLPYGTVSAVVSVTYLNYQNSEITADLEDFILTGDDLCPEGSDWVWMGGSMRDESVRVRYHAGYGTVPEPIKAAAKLMLGDLHRFRSSASDMNITPTSIPMSLTVQTILQPYRKYI